MRVVNINKEDGMSNMIFRMIFPEERYPTTVTLRNDTPYSEKDDTLPKLCNSRKTVKYSAEERYPMPIKRTIPLTGCTDLTLDGSEIKRKRKLTNLLNQKSCTLFPNTILFLDKNVT